MTPTSAAIEVTEENSPRDRDGGFTLVEVVLALTIVGMLATLAIPFFRPGEGGGALRARANEIASLMRRDRNMAFHLRRSSTVVFDVAGGSVRSDLLDETINLPKGIALRLAPDTADSVVFHADGSSSGARILLVGQRGAMAIVVNRLTATVRISEVDQ